MVCVRFYEFGLPEQYELNKFYLSIIVINSCSEFKQFIHHLCSSIFNLLFLTIYIYIKKYLLPMTKKRESVISYGNIITQIKSDQIQYRKSVISSLPI